MPYFQGGDLDGMAGYEESIDGPLSRQPTEQDFAGAGGPPGGMMGGPPMGGPPGMGMMGAAGPEQEAGEGSMSPAQKLDRALTLAREAVASDGEYDEQEKSVIEKATTLFQSLRAAREKQEEGMMQGKISPGAMKRAYAGAGAAGQSGPAGY